MAVVLRKRSSQRISDDTQKQGPTQFLGKSRDHLACVWAPPSREEGSVSWNGSGVRSYKVGDRGEYVPRRAGGKCRGRGRKGR